MGACSMKRQVFRFWNGQVYFVVGLECNQFGYRMKMASVAGIGFILVRLPLKRYIVKVVENVIKK